MTKYYTLETIAEYAQPRGVNIPLATLEKILNSKYAYSINPLTLKKKYVIPEDEELCIPPLEEGTKESDDPLDDGPEESDMPDAPEQEVEGDTYLDRVVDGIKDMDMDVPELDDDYKILK